MHEQKYLHALFEPLGLRILLVALAATLGVVLVGQVDDDLPLSVRVDRALRPPVEDVGGADVAAALVVVLGVGVASERLVVAYMSMQSCRSYMSIH
jgi:hypothetical protein